MPLRFHASGVKGYDNDNTDDDNAHAGLYKKEGRP